MIITLNDKEITDALIQYVDTMGVNTSGKEVTVDMTAGRGSNGYKAEITIGATTTTEEPVVEDNVVSIESSTVEEEDTPSTTSPLFG